MLWWKVNEKNFAVLSKLAKYFLGIPASSATSERIFSAGGLTVSHLRCTLDDEKVEEAKLGINETRYQSINLLHSQYSHTFTTLK